MQEEFIGRSESVVVLEGGGTLAKGRNEGWVIRPPTRCGARDRRSHVSPERLCPERDRLGVPMTILDWRLTKIDRNSAQRAV